MAYKRGEIVYARFPTPPDNMVNPPEHPGVVLSTEQFFSDEKIYVIAMITNAKINDRYSLMLEAKHFIDPTHIPTGQVRCHLIMYFQESELRPYKHGVQVILKRHKVDEIVTAYSDDVLGLGSD